MQGWLQKLQGGLGGVNGGGGTLVTKGRLRKVAARGLN